MKFDKLSYLERIGLKPEDIRDLNLAALKKLHYNHLLNIPFENLDIHWGNKITLDIEKLYNKIVVNKRGGFCYELNGLFYELLRSLGYNVKMISAKVYSTRDNSIGPEFDHLALIVTIDDKQYLCDVGFGCNTAEPLEFKTDMIQNDKSGEFIIKKHDDDYYLMQKLVNDSLLDLYYYTDIKRELIDFEEMCNYHQSSPDSHFTKNKVCSKLTEDGMVTVSGNNLIVTTNGIRDEIIINNDDEFNEQLMKYFGVLNNEVKVIK